ncbi:MAG: SIMPL domain-containing protein, partial [Limisphaerales bacterium]
GAEFHVRFDVKDRNEVKNRAIAAAVENAKARATVLAEAAGVSVGRILNISYGFEEVRISSDVEFQLSAPEAPDFDGPDLDAQDLIAKDHVTITCAIG